MQQFWWLAYNFDASHTKRGTESATVLLHSSIWLKSTEQKVLTFSAITTWEISLNPHLPAQFCIHCSGFFFLLSNPRLVITIILLYDTLQMSVFLKDWVSGAHIQVAEGAFWVLSVQIGTKVVRRLLQLYHIFYFFEKSKNYLYVQRNQPYLMAFMDTVQCHRMTQKNSAQPADL